MAPVTPDKMRKPKPRRGLFGRFVRDRRAASAVEFGLVAVPFLGLLLAIFETGLVFLNNEGLEASVQDAARNIMTGRAQSAGIATASDFVNTYMCPATGTRILPSFIDCTKLIVDVRAADTFATADTSKTFYRDPTTQQFCPGANGKIIVVRVAYPMPVFLPILAAVSSSGVQQVTTGLVNDVPGNPGWKHLLVGTAVFQNEPFAASSYTAPSGCPS